MPNFAVINDGVVINVIVCDTKELAEQITHLTCVEFDLELREAGIGHAYDGSKFIAPIVEPAPLPEIPE
jgi:hypothetical protein